MPPKTRKSVGWSLPRTWLPPDRLDVCRLTGWLSDAACVDVMLADEEAIDAEAEVLLSVEVAVLMVVGWLVAAKVMGTMSPELQATPFQAL
jgi:hypothetical protein